MTYKFLEECTRLTASCDLTPWSWKKTFPASSGHTVLISSLLIPRSSLPVRTPRLDTVLAKRSWQPRIPCLFFINHSFLLNNHPEVRDWSLHSRETSALKPCFHFCRSGVVVESNLAPWVPLWSRVKKRVLNHLVLFLCSATVLLAHPLLFRGFVVLNLLQNVWRNVALLVTGVSNKPPWPRFLDHLSKRGADHEIYKYLDSSASTNKLEKRL